MGWFGTFLWAVYIIFVLAALLDNNIGLFITLLSPFLAIGVLLLVLFAIAAVSGMVRAFRKRAAYLRKYARWHASEKNGRVRLVEAFRPIVEHQQSVNRRLLEWMREQARATDKPEYRKVLEGQIKLFTEQDGLCNFYPSSFSGFLEDQPPHIDLGALPDHPAGMRLKPGELVDREELEREVRFVLYGPVAADGNRHWTCHAALDLAGARRIIECAVVHYLKQVSFYKAIQELDFDRGSCKRLITGNSWPSREILHYESCAQATAAGKPESSLAMIDSPTHDRKGE